MPETDTASSVLPVHIEETIQSIAGLNAEHRANATHHQRFVDRITSLLGRVSFIAALTTFVAGPPIGDRGNERDAFRVRARIPQGRPGLSALKSLTTATE